MAKSAIVNSSQFEEPLEAAKSCLPMLRKYFNNSKLGFTPSNRFDKATRYTLTGEGQQRARAREDYPIHYLCQSGLEMYWIAVAVDFRFMSAAYQLTDAAIIVFKSESGYAEKLPYLRAEWHSGAEYLTARNAQPHWHVYSESPSKSHASFEPGAVTEFRPTTSIENTISITQHAFHFAMAASWHLGDVGTHIHKVSDTACLKHWLAGCLSYIREQLDPLP